jgi:hypothetical protein
MDGRGFCRIERLRKSVVHVSASGESSIEQRPHWDRVRGGIRSEADRVYQIPRLNSTLPSLPPLAWNSGSRVCADTA